MSSKAIKPADFGAFLPEDALWFSERGLRLGRAEVITHAEREGRQPDRLEAMLTIAFQRRLPAHLIRHVVEAADLSRHGDQALANIRLALAGLSCVPDSHDFQKRAAMAHVLLAEGMSVSELLGELDPSPVDLAKFDPSQLRVPPGHGAESGRWTSGDGTVNVTAASAAVALRAAPLLAPELGATTMAALTALAATVGFAAVAGALFVPWQNAVSTSGPLPGPGGNSYSYDHDEGLLRVLGASGEVFAAGHQDRSGVFFDADTGVPFAREVGGALQFDRDTLAAVRDEDAPLAWTRADTDDDEPKLCPEPGPDQPGSDAASDRAKAYQEQISRMINPQRPLEYGLAMSLTDPLSGKLVHYDECDEKTGTMIDAKGPGFDGLLGFSPAEGNVTERWLDQSYREVRAAGARRVEWYFAEAKAAAYASKLFAARRNGRERIIIKVQPAERS